VPVPACAPEIVSAATEPAIIATSATDAHGRLFRPLAIGALSSYPRRFQPQQTRVGSPQQRQAADSRRDNNRRSRQARNAPGSTKSRSQKSSPASDRPFRRARSRRERTQREAHPGGDSL